METNMNLTAVTDITTTQMHHARLRKLNDLDTMLTAEYPALSVHVTLNEDGSKVVTIVAQHTGDEITTIYEGDKVPLLANLLETCEDLGLDPEAGAEDDEPKGSSSVVDMAYRLLYAEKSTTGQSCGDWLAEWLAVECLGADGLRVDDFQAILDHNHVDQSGKWARLPESGQQGWRGRWRMNGRQALEKAVALRGKLINVVGAEADMPESVLADLRTKHDKWLTKERKRLEAMDAVMGKDA